MQLISSVGLTPDEWAFNALVKLCAAKNDVAGAKDVSTADNTSMSDS